METGVHSSFIPPDTAEPVYRRRAERGSLFDFLSLMSVVLFVVSLTLAAGVFLYNQYLETSKKSKVAQLERAKAAFEPALIEELTRLDDRMVAAGILLSNHIAPSIFFHMLELVTLQTVSFRSMNFNVIDSRNITIRMIGVAESVNSVALQADLFSKNGIITSPIFSGIDRQEDGVHFNLQALINPDAIRYSRFFTEARREGSQQNQGTPEDGQSAEPPSPFGPQSEGQAPQE